jgi:ATP-dependent DNA helicase UvrD/PcrA
VSMLAGHPGVRAALRGHDPSPEQEQAITAPLGPCWVVAGAGSGKTAIMAARLVWLVEQGIAPDMLLGLTFTHKASQELLQRVRMALDSSNGSATGFAPEPTITTYHGLADMMVTASATRLGLRGSRLVSEAHRWQVLLQAAQGVSFESLEVRTPGVLADALILSSRLADHEVPPEKLVAFEQEFSTRERKRALARPVREASSERAELARLVVAFREEKKARGIVDFDDQITLAVELASDPEVAEEIRKRWSAVLLDEYQDTNIAQVELVKKLWGQAAFPISAVGDPQQAIYGFRGATLDNLVSFPTHFTSAKPLQLSTSFRCDRLVLDVANSVASRLPKEQQGPRLSPRNGAGPGTVELFWAVDHLAEAEEIARRMDELRNAYDFGQMAILIRSRQPLFPAVRTALEERGIPVEVVGLGGLLEVPEIVELVTTLRVLHDPASDRHLARWLLGPQLRVSPGDIAVLATAARARDQHLLDAARAAAGEGQVLGSQPADAGANGLSSEARARCAELIACYDQMQRAMDRPLAEIAELVLDLRGIRAEIESWPEQRGTTARHHINSFLDYVTRFAPLEGGKSLGSFLEYLGAVSRQPDEAETVLPPRNDAVTLLTIHQAKGLEFDVVFLPMLVKGRMPASWAATSWVDQRELLPSPLRRDQAFLPRFDEVKEVYAAFERMVKEHSETEERRVLYVALTRARHHIIGSGAWYYGSDSRPSSPSSFYEELANVPGVSESVRPECPEESPIVQRTFQEAARWPGTGRSERGDDLFPQGLSRSIAGVADLLSSLPADEREQAQLEAARLEALELPAPPSREPSPPVVSVTALESLARCPRRFYWESVRPLPRLRTHSMAVGAAVHEEIERRAHGSPPSRPTEPARRAGHAYPAHRGVGGTPGATVSDALSAFERSRFSGRSPLLAEAPFSLVRGPWTVVGRIDAIYEGSPPVRWEIVDWKTGLPPGVEPGGDPAEGLQMDIYGLGAVEAFGQEPGEVDLTVIYLGHQERTRRFDASEVRRADARLNDLLSRLDESCWDALPGPHCAHCDYRDVCPWAQG